MIFTEPNQDSPSKMMIDRSQMRRGPGATMNIEGKLIALKPEDLVLNKHEKQN